MTRGITDNSVVYTVDFCPFEHCIFRTPYCVLRNHVDIIHLTIIIVVMDYTQYEVQSTQCSNI